MKNAPELKQRQVAAEIEALRELIEAHPLWGAIEVAGAVGVTVSNLDDVAGLPEPVQRVRASRLWIADEVQEFAVGYNRRRTERAAKRLKAV